MIQEAQTKAGLCRSTWSGTPWLLGRQALTVTPACAGGFGNPPNPDLGLPGLARTVRVSRDFKELIKMTEPIRASITLGGFIDFASASASKRVAAVQDVADIQLARYDRGRDFYAGVREAITFGIANGDDLRRMRRAVDECTPRRRENYQAVAEGWESWRRGKNLSVFSQPLYWQEQSLQVRVSPKFTWRQRGATDVIIPYFKDAELSGDATQAAIRIMELTFPPESGRPALLDVRRGRVYRRRRRSNNFDTWLTGEVSAFLAMLGSITDVA
jgi:hypothetical protein